MKPIPALLCTLGAMVLIGVFMLAFIAALVHWPAISGYGTVCVLLAIIGVIIYNTFRGD
jgi:hypothetical protein